MADKIEVPLHPRLHQLLMQDFESHLPETDIKIYFHEMNPAILIVEVWGEVEDPMSTHYGQHESARAVIARGQFFAGVRRLPTIEWEE